VRTPAEILREAKTIAMIGASPNSERPSNSVMRYLLAQGYDVIPVRPAGCDEVLGVPCVRTLDEIDREIDVVDVFRRAELTPAHAREAVAAGVTVTIDSDCHVAKLLDRQMRLGVGTARRGWVEPRHVLNARSLSEVRAFIAAKRRTAG